VALHVQAKRCLAGAQASYLSKLSADSVRSLALQGGPMNAEERSAFLRLPQAHDALRLRVWDDLAKDVSLQPSSREQALHELRTLFELVLAQDLRKHQAHRP
jgi:predicted HD phosphohydrolase